MPDRHLDQHPAEPAPDAPVDVVGVAIVDTLASPTVLLGARRVHPPELAGSWELPGGKVEPGETWHQAAHREIAEELGVRIRLGTLVEGPLADGRWRLSPRHLIVVWLAEVIAGEPAALEEHDQLRWLAPAEVDEVAWLPGDRPIVRAVLSRW